MTGVPLFVMQTKEEVFTGRGDSIVTVKLVIRVGSAGRFSMDLGGGLFHSLGPTSLKNRYGLGNFFLRLYSLLIGMRYSTDTSIAIPFQVLVWVSDSIRMVSTSLTYPVGCEYFRYSSQFEQDVETTRAPGQDGPITVNASHCIYPSSHIPYFRRGYPRTL